MHLKNNNYLIFFALTILQLNQNLFCQQSYQILSSSPSELVIDIKINLESPQDIQPFDVLIGLPSDNLPQIEIEELKEESHSFKLLQSNQKTGWTYSQRVNDLNTGTLTINPSTNRQTYFKHIIIKIIFFQTSPGWLINDSKI